MNFEMTELNDVTAASFGWKEAAAIGAGVVIGIALCD